MRKTSELHFQTCIDCRRLFSPVTMMDLCGFLFSVTALFASSVCATGSTFSPKNGINYTVAVPASTASSGHGSIYLQLTALTSHTWVGLGIGESMAGATMFIIYTSGDGNVTISPRTGTGHVMPQFNPSAQVILLEGSGVENGLMTANVRYVAAHGLLDFTSTASNWISSWQLGPFLNSPSQSETITQHDGHDQLTFDLTKATIASDTNPYAGNFANNTSASSGSSGSESSGSEVTLTSTTLSIFETAHGIIMASVMVVILPLGALVLRIFGGVWLHAAIQVFGLCAMITGFGLGIHLAQTTDYLFNNSHTIFGTVIISLFMVQPFLGLLHHRKYKKHNKRSYFGISHIWYGRVLIILGVINGGLGLQLASNSTNGEIAYGVISGTIFIIYTAIIFVIMWRYKSSTDRSASKAEKEIAKAESEPGSST